jgi:nucleotide-binding universal stress UspA family protein
MNDTSVVLVPLDGSSAATVALPVAHALARTLDASLHVVHVSPERTETPADPAAACGLRPEECAGLVVEALVGEPAGEIVRAAHGWDSSFVVLCACTGPRTGRGVLGPVAAEVVARAERPVVVVPPTRGNEPWGLRTMLIPHEGGPAVACKLSSALSLAQRAGSDVCVLHVVCPHSPPGSEPGALATPRYVDQQHHEWPAWAREFVERLAMGTPAGLRSLRLWLARGEPASTIRQFADQHRADLVVMCSHGNLEPGRAAVLHGVLRDARVPVLVLRLG